MCLILNKEGLKNVNLIKETDYYVNSEDLGKLLQDKEHIEEYVPEGEDRDYIVIRVLGNTTPKEEGHLIENTLDDFHYKQRNFPTNFDDILRIIY